MCVCVCVVVYVMQSSDQEMLSSQWHWPVEAVLLVSWWSDTYKPAFADSLLLTLVRRYQQVQRLLRQVWPNRHHLLPQLCVHLVLVCTSWTTGGTATRSDHRHTNIRPFRQRFKKKKKKGVKRFTPMNTEQPGTDKRKKKKEKEIYIYTFGHTHIHTKQNRVLVFWEIPALVERQRCHWFVNT